MQDDLPPGYAEVTDLETYWGRTLSEAEQGRAAVLLGWAAKRIQEEPGWQDFDTLVCAQVSMDMVKRAMVGRSDGVIETSAAMSDMSATQRYANPMGSLYLTDTETRRLAGKVAGAGISLALKSNVRVPGEYWNCQPSSQETT